MFKVIKNILETDILIIGSGGAGCRAAIEAARNDVRVLLATKGVFNRCGATVTAGLYMNVPSSRVEDVCGIKGSMEDSEENFCRDMFEEGKYINDEDIVREHCTKAAEYIKELISWGMRIDGLHQSPGHKHPRSIVSTGRSMVQAINKEIKKYNIKYLENTMITNLLITGEHIAGAVGINLMTGDFVVVKAKAVILATGGAMGIYPITTAPQELTGDGMYMALEAGAKLVDMEFPLFLPSCLYWPSSMKGSSLPYECSEAIGGWWLNAFGERFLKKWDPMRMEAGTTRDIASIAQAMEILEGRGSPHGGIYVSFKHLPDELITAYLENDPQVKNYQFGGFNLLKFNVDPRKVSYEAGPAAHYWNGGIKINAKCETNIAGLYAAGEVQGGTMGANRLAGNAITECLVFGALAGLNASRHIKMRQLLDIESGQLERYYEKIYAPLKRKQSIDIIQIKNHLQKIAFNTVGPIRNESGLEKGIKEIKKIKNEIIPNMAARNKEKIYNREWMEILEMDSLLNIIEIVLKSSLIRKESRGALYRTDYTDTDNKEWLRNVVVYKKRDKLIFDILPVNNSMVKLPKPEKIPYMVPKWEFSRQR